MKAQPARPVQTAALFLLAIVVWLIGPAPPAGALLQVGTGARLVPSYAYDTVGLDYDAPAAVALSPAANSALSTAQAAGFDGAASEAQGHHRHVYDISSSFVAPSGTGIQQINGRNLYEEAGQGLADDACLVLGLDGPSTT